MTRKFDLHLHTNASDGLLEPEEVVRAAAAMGLWCIAITDHDCTGGVHRAQQEGRKLGLPVISGAEFTADFSGELHILGYGIDTGSEAYNTFVGEQQRRRAERNTMMLRKLQDMGMIMPEKYTPENVSGVYGRMHMAMGLLSAGYVQSVQHAFDRYLRIGAPAYVRRQKFDSATLIKAITDSKGAAVLAHPGRLGIDNSALGQLVRGLSAEGLKGIEAYYPTHTADEVDFFVTLAEDSSLVCTYGSDWHGYAEAGIAMEFDRFAIKQETYDWLEAMVASGV